MMEPQHPTRHLDFLPLCFAWTDVGPIDVDIVDYH